MASPAGNPSQPSPIDIHKLFKPPPQIPNPNPSSPSPFPPTSYPLPPQPSYPPPPSTAFSYPPPTPPFQHHAFLHYPHDPLYPHIPNPNPNPSPNPAPNHGARLMALLTPSPLESAASMPPPSPHELQPVLQASSSAPVAPPARAPSSKMPRGRHLGGGDRAVYDVDSRLPGESHPPQLEVTPITKYNSDPGLVLGRQIAVNRSYICYGLKLGNIRVLNINTALRALLRGHTQRVTDMAFFAEDVHLLVSASADGRVYVWKIDEGRDEENKPQISGKIVTAIQIVGDGEPYHPRICWHSHKQEILVVGIGNYVLKLDTTKVGRGKAVSADEPLICDVEKLIEGVQLVGKHDGEVTDLSISQWMTTRLASASKDGTIKIWEDRRTMPLATLRPHGGQPVNSVEFLTSPHRPNHIVLITAGPLNREVKIWTSTGDEGWLLPSDSESWQCTQTLELRSSSEPQTEEAFFNQVVVLPRSSIILLANAKKNAIYAVHVDYGSCPSSTRMDYIADFTVAIPILSLTGTSDYLPDGEPVVQVYCVQTQAIQQYALVLSQCLPPPNDNIIPGKDSSISRGSEGLDVIVSSQGSNIGEVSTVLDLVASNAEAMPSAPVSEVADIAHVASSSPLPSNLELSVRISALKPPPKVLEKGPSLGDSDVDQSVLDSDISVVSNSHLTFKLGGGNAAHLITPAELMAGAISSSENALVNQGEGKLHGATISKDVQSEVEVEVLGDSRPSQHEIVDFQIPEPRDEMVRECGNLTKESISVEEASLVDGIATAGPSEQPFRVGEEETRDGMREMLENVAGFAVTTASISGSDAKGKKHKGKQGQALDPSSPSLSRLNSTYSSNEPESSESVPLTEAAFSQIQTVQETLNQLVAMQAEMEKQISTMVTANTTKEGKRLEAALGRSMEKVVKANVDALWARMQEENAKHEKVEKERMQQITSLITTCTNKDLPSILDRALKKEISALGPNVARAITPVIEKAISSAITESFQRGVGDKAVNQLEKSVNSKLEATVARHIQAQFQTSGKQILQDALRSSLESSLIPAFEVACKAMFEQVDTTFQKGMTEYASTAQQQLESAHTPLALTLRDAINSASSITQNMTSELADGQRKLLALVAAGNPKASNPITMQQQSNGPMNIRPDMVEAPLDPKKELTRLISEHNYVEAFTSALQRSDVSIVSWLCSQVDLRGICSTVPLPLSQGVLLALLQQLACDINNDTPRKLGWMMSVAVAINPSDPMIALHVRPILEQVYNILAHLRSSSPAISPTEVRTIMLVINSVLMSCK